MVFVRWSSSQRLAGLSFGLLIVVAFGVMGQGVVALGLLASFGAATGFLLATGQLITPFRRESEVERISRVLTDMPTAISITTLRGKPIWSSDSFLGLMKEYGCDPDLSKLGAAYPSVSAPLFRLFSAAKGGKAHSERIILHDKIGSDRLRLSVTPSKEDGRTPQTLIWEIEVLARKEQAQDALGAGESRTLSEKAGALTAVKTQSPSAKTAPGGAVLGQVSVANAFDSLLRHTPLATALLNRAGAVHIANSAFRSLLLDHVQQSNVTEPAGKFLASFLGDEAAAASLSAYFAEIAANPAQQPKPLELSTTLKAKSGLVIRLALGPVADGETIVAFAYEGGMPPALDEQTVQSQKLQAVGELAGGIAHDFNNLLTAIIGFSDLLLSRFRASDPAFKDVNNIKSNAIRAAELVQQILAYSRRQTLQHSMVSLTDVVQDFHVKMGRTLGEKIKFQTDFGRELWYVKADLNQMFQVVLNLAINARDAMPNGGDLIIRTANISERESLALKDQGLERGEYVLCEVRDTGTGIEKKKKKKIFDPFFTTKGVGKGTGLGLSMAFGFVKQTGGVIIVNSKLGEGTAFQIYLPRYVETEEDLKSLQQKVDSAEKSGDLTGNSIVLLVEDEDAVRSFASRALATRGYTVLEAASGVEAIEVMDREDGRIDLVVSDVVMPEMDGPTMLKHLRKRKPDLKVIFMSGYAEEAFRKNLGDDQNFIFLPKPFTLKKLAETVKLAAA